ncbi:MAG: type II secretion system F family protein [Bacillus sp. (in: Bacteria)]|nr:type II secretion system F family protein [Bacillus sp. (in: firmicutes)]
MEKRIKRYLIQGDKEVLEPKKFKLTIDFRLAKERIRKKLVEKDKNTKIENLLRQAGVPLKPEEYVMFQWISTALTAGILYLILDTIFILPIGALIGAYIPKFILKKRKQDRMKKFNDSLPEMISTIVGALRAGFSFPQALKTVMEESSSPMKDEIGIVIREMQYGTSVEEALNNLKERMPSEDLDIMVQAVLIQRQVGGNLATVLETIVKTIRERIRIQGQISTLTAQGRLSGMVVGLLPVGLGLILYIIEPGYMGTLFTHPVGIVLLVIAVISCALGFMFIRKVTAIEV